MEVVARGIIFDASLAPPHKRFCTFPSVERLNSGSFVAAFRTGSAKDCSDEDAHIMVSDDDGTTWLVAFSGFGDIPPGSGGRMRAPAVTEISPGKLIGSFTWIDHSDPALPLANPETQGILPSKVFVAESEDAGRFWSPLREVPLQPHRGNATTGAILALKDGTLALPYEAWKDYHDPSPGEHHAALRLSTDGGKSWPTSAIVAHDRQNRLLFWDQRLCVNPDDGHLIGMFWTHDRRAQQDAPIHIAWGSPDGKEWTQPVSTGIAGQICAPLALPGGRLFAAYVHRHEPPSLRAVLSDDAGHNWNTAQELVFYEKRKDGQESGMDGQRDFGDYWADMSIWTFGHPTPLLLPNDHVMVAYYAGDPTAMSVHWVRIAL
jgi:hypothetical protein